MQKQSKSQNGFTLLEIVAVLVIIGILGTIAVNRWTNLDAEIYSGADALKNHLRYAQAQAMNRDPNIGDNTIMGFTYDASANQYWMFAGTNTANAQILPDDMRYTTSSRAIALNEKKIRLNMGFTILFDNRGIPYRSYTSASNNEPRTTPLVIIVSGQSGTQTISVTVTPRTGFVP